MTPRVTRVLVVGASGFVGQAVCRELLSRGMEVVAATRQTAGLPPGTEHRPIGDLSEAQPWIKLVEDVDSVVYLAARVHVMNDTHPDPLAAYRAINRDAALDLARAAAQAGVRRMVYLSSVKVNGEASVHPLTEADIPAPTDPYGRSKWEAEQLLLQLGRETNLDMVVLRPPLVYGPGVKANFMQLARVASSGLPLPLGAIDNRRSMVYVGNLADAIRFVLETPRAADQTFFVSDGEDLSTTRLTRLLVQAAGQTARLVPVPVPLIRAGGKVLGRQAVTDRLTGSLQVDSGRLQRLGWTPPFSVEQGLGETARQLKSSAHYVRSTAPYRLSLRQRAYLVLRSPVERVIAGVMLLLLAPVLLLVASAVQLTSPGPALFLQKRAGRGHRPFVIYKFRTMRSGTPHLSTEDLRRSGDNPVTPVGSFLRRTSLDELPQLINVLRGEMSFVGPRPALMTQTPVLRGREAAGVDVLAPGITGLAQVSGRDDLSDAQKVERDARYFRHIGLATDLLIIAFTLRGIVGGKGIY